MIGADIEFFLADPATGKPIPICGKIGGIKGKPIQITEQIGVLEDGAAAELNYTPQLTGAAFAELIGASTPILSTHVGMAVFNRPEARLVGLKKFPQAMEIGCMPDYDAYSTTPTMAREIPDITQFGSYRFAGGHIHLSYETKEAIPPWAVARFIDYYVTVPLLWWTNYNYGTKAATDLIGAKRSKFYGLAGLYRPKDYGVEYRTFSNYFALHPAICRRLGQYLDQMQIKLMVDGLNNLNTQYLAIDWDRVKTAIDTLNFPLCREIVDDAE